MQCFAFLFLVVNTSAVDCLEGLVCVMTCYVLGGALNPACSLTHRVAASRLTIHIGIVYCMEKLK